MPVTATAKTCRLMKVWVSVAVIFAVVSVAFSAPPFLAEEMVAAMEEDPFANRHSASVATVTWTNTGSTSISCTGRCTYKAVYNGTFLTVYGKGFTPYEVIEFRLNEVYLGRSDTADANGDVVTWFKRSIPSGTYQLYAHEAHTAKNSNILTFIVTGSEPQTITAGPTTSSTSTIPSTTIEPSGSVAGDYSLVAVVISIIVATIAIIMLTRRRAQ